MIKRILLTLFVIIIVGLGILWMLSNSIKMDWGHHFSFENELGLQIDSLEIAVGDVKTIILAGTDSLKSLEGNIDVPKKGYPHEVGFKIYSGENVLTLKADSFNCFNCDGNHEYRLKESGAEYNFRN